MTAKLDTPDGRAQSPAVTRTPWLADPDADRATREYHARQFETPYRSTVLFVEWLHSLGLFALDEHSRVLDVGAGQGANLLYLARRYPQLRFEGLELNPTLVAHGNDYFERVAQANCRLFTGDLYRMGELRNRFAGLLSLQTLSWLPTPEEPLREMASLQPRFIALTSLFYEGNISCEIRVTDHDRPGDGDLPHQSFYNVYSLPRIRAVLADAGYPHFEYRKFEIDIDLPRPSHPGMGSYTEQTGDGRRLQISGPLLMPWYFIAATREPRVVG
jgi:SAM-dependent methyltransferase